MSTPTAEQLESATPTELLHLAANLGRTDLLVAALRAGAEVNALLPSPTTKTPQTALHLAIASQNLDTIRALLQTGATLSTPNHPTPLTTSPQVLSALSAHICQRAAIPDLPALRDFHAAGLDLSAHDGSSAKNTPLHWAASFGRLPAVSLLLELGVPSDLSNARQHTPLRDASAAGHLPVVRALLAAGANPDAKGDDARSAIDVARDDAILGALLRRDTHPVRPSGAAGHTIGEAPTSTPRTPFYVPGERAVLPDTVEEEVPGWGRLIWPRPQRFVAARPEGLFTVPPVVTVSVEGGCMAVGRVLLAGLQPVLGREGCSLRLVGGGVGGLGEAIGFSAAIFLRVDADGMERGEQSYRVTVRDFGVDVVGCDLQGLFYGCGTLLNVVMIRCAQKSDVAAPVTIPTFSISDWPAVRRRGLYLDLSGRRLLKLGTLEKLVTFLAMRMKMNQVQIKLGANFQRLEVADGDAEAALKHEELLELNEICGKLFVELIPVTGLCETLSRANSRADVNGGDDEHGHEAIKKEVLEREKLYDELLPLFDSKQVNVEELSRQASCSFSDFERLRSAANSLRSRGKRTVQVFGNKMKDVLSDRTVKSGALAELPARTVMILESESFEGGSFQEACSQLRQYGVSFYTCSSSCTEYSIAGRTSSGIEGCQRSIATALDQGAAGVLLKDTSCCTDGAPLVFLYQALVPFAGVSWNPKHGIECGPTGPDDFLSHLYDMYIFNDPVEKGLLGGIAASLGDLHRIAGDVTGNALFLLLGHRKDEAGQAMENMSYLGLRRALKRAERIENALSSYDGNADLLAVDELHASAILLSVSARLGASLFSISSATSMDSNRSLPESGVDIAALPDGRRSDLCNALLQAIELLRAVWIKQYYKAGFTEAIESIVGETVDKLAQGMPYQGYLENRKAEGWAPTDDG